ncbi:MAG TPA: amidase family protein [Phenylobacterium sp.]|uniref:amidase family protein n=1 Tax=Phenylobacterium sp. TaxID=1871053 RepID=UPI002D1DAD0B|nr:amidase family protein [Phenylobacterium sp.]HSV02848.1 amidase family protein [Phenylobacterium sp.]
MSETTISRDLLDGSAGELARALAARQVSALELADAAIARIEARDGAINAVVVRDFARAREAARAADAALARGERGPLLGVPMTVKESHDVAGLPSTWGFEPFQAYVAPKDSIGVARLKAAGAVILGKTNVPVMLSDWQSVNPIYGRTVNPWDPTRSPGGSSGGGAAALAAGMIPLEFGSDIGGSIRVPAAFCGVYGHKPSFGLIPTRGHAPGGLDGAPVPLAVVGPLARTSADLALALEVLAGPDELEGVGYRLALPEPRGTRLADYRVLIVDAVWGVALDNEIKAALAALAERLERAGAKVTRDASRLPEPGRSREVYMGLLNTAMSRGRPDAQPIDAHRYMALLDGQLALRRAWAELFGEFDVVLAPVMGTVAFPHTDEADWSKRTHAINGQATPYGEQIAWPAIALTPNLPATAAPIGFTKGGLPIAAQIIGPYLEDRTTLAFAGLLEREFGGFRAPPPL